MRNLYLTASLACICSSGLWADFSYEQTSQITGGMMVGAMKLAGAFSKQAREPIKTTTMVKGNRMVHLSAQSATITDLDKETITEINFQKKTYSVITFQQMAQAMQQLGQDLKQSEVQTEVKASIKDTGETRQIRDFSTKQVIMTMEMESTDPKSGQKGAMVVTAEMWMASSIAGYGEVREFHKRMAQKLNWAPGMSVGAMGGAGMSQGMSALAKEAGKLEGIPVLQITRMGMKGEAVDQAQTDRARANSEQSQSQQQSAPQPNAREAASQGAQDSVAGRLGRIGGIGGLGGLGRKKKAEEPPAAPPPPPPPPQQQAQSQPAPAAPAQPGAPGSLMVMNTELVSYSASVDASKFEVPAGFKQVESEMLKRRK